MKHLLFSFTVLSLFMSSALAQSKLEFGLTTEGSWFMPGKYSKDTPPNKDRFGGGIGTYVKKNLSGRLSADVGILFRYKEMREYVTQNYIQNEKYGYVSSINTDEFDPYDGHSPYDGGYGGSGYNNYDSGTSYSYEQQTEFWKNYPMYYMVVPIHLQYLLHKNLFVRGGIEASWLTNYYTASDKTELNWIIGFGSQHHKLSWSVNYIRGFKEVAFDNKQMASFGKRTFTVYRNNMIQLSLSYPLWPKKQALEQVK